MTWKSIECHCDLPNWYYAYAGEGRLTDGSPSLRLALPFRTGEPLKVQWPDGTCEEVKLEDGPIAGRLGVYRKVKGATAYIDLCNLQVFDPTDEGEWVL